MPGLVLRRGWLQVGLWIDAGSRYENERNNGVAHFLEHMAFKVRQWSLERMHVFTWSVIHLLFEKCGPYFIIQQPCSKCTEL